MQAPRTDWSGTQLKFQRNGGTLSRIAKARFDCGLSTLESDPDGGWSRTEERLRQLLELPQNWDTYGGRAPDQATVAYAAAELASLKALRLPPPVISPSGDGAIVASWAAADIEIELWFEGLYREAVLIDDPRGEIDSPEGSDPFQTTQALRKIQARM